ncbi:adenine/guanine phosphoribosyltransferase-like PRPP-binding protein [Natronocella acetinitrilica]|uniref:Adenine/guanine phosphoribosyltransferase-like PRPP-binding protein n=1 Tax=Natronocella acetinitrilica TaxID=414046 RepID=A0AAE3KBG8_9GAMM|nr:phosphoribosyltransferase [Natronocella acetinitrilica]MCP1673563.1 adenine/guanine phosphoribosyltransferase-like PRPP-binding protein [Natronocella acetinitrilica]
MNRTVADGHFTEPTTHYWQSIEDAPGCQSEPPWQYHYPARLPDGRVLRLPIRQLADTPEYAVASLICNQAAMSVVEELSGMLAERLAALRPDFLLGLPTLGLTVIPTVAGRLNHTRFLPLGYSRKFWYDDSLSTSIRSITSPDSDKRLYLDPNLLPLARGRKVALVDDTISSGHSMEQTWDFCEALGMQVIGCGVLMLQGKRWLHRLGEERSRRVCGVLESPLLQAVPDGWVERR